MSRLRRGVTLIETLLAVAIAAMSSAALLVAVESALSTATDAADRTIADGLAQQLLDEIAQKRYVEPGASATSTSLGPNSSETTLAGRIGYDDIDDYYDFTSSPPCGIGGEALGVGNDAGGSRPENFRLPSSYFSRWRLKSRVFYVDAATLQPLSSGTSNYRCIEVTVEQKDSSNNFIPLSTKRRVVAYVPPASS